MMYQFSKKHLLVLAISLAVLGFLTFSAGVVTGIGLAMPTREEVALLKAAKPATAVAAAVPPHVPAAVPALALPSLPVPPAATPPAKPDRPAAPAAMPAAEPVATQASREAPAAAPAAAAPAGKPAPADSQNEFALQLGSFRDLNHAKQLQSDMKDRGYSTSILTALDADQREWHVVRIEGYKTLASASQAAADFIGKERIPAVVRRSKAL